MRSPSRVSATLPTVTLFEHEAISYDELGVHSDAQFSSELEQLNVLSGEDLVRLGRRHLRATQFVGVSPEQSHHGIDGLAADLVSSIQLKRHCWEDLMEVLSTPACTIHVSSRMRGGWLR